MSYYLHLLNVVSYATISFHEFFHVGGKRTSRIDGDTCIRFGLLVYSEGELLGNVGSRGKGDYGTLVSSVVVVINVEHEFACFLGEVVYPTLLAKGYVKVAVSVKRHFHPATCCRSFHHRLLDVDIRCLRAGRRA